MNRKNEKMTDPPSLSFEEDLIGRDAVITPTPESRLRDLPSTLHKNDDTEEESESDREDDITHIVRLTRPGKDAPWHFSVEPHTFPVRVEHVTAASELRSGDAIVEINAIAPESHDDAVRLLQRARAHLHLRVRRRRPTPPPAPPTPPRRRSSTGLQLDRLLRASPIGEMGPARCASAAGSAAAGHSPRRAAAVGRSASLSAAVEGEWGGLMAARHLWAARPLAPPVPPFGRSALCAAVSRLPRAPRHAVHDRRGCPLPLGDAFHDAVQRAMTRAALSRPAGDAVAWAGRMAPAARVGAGGAAEAEAMAEAEARGAAALAERGGELARMHAALLRVVEPCVAAARREMRAETERLAEAERAARELLAVYSAATATGRTTGGKRRAGNRVATGNELHTSSAIAAAAGVEGWASRVCGLPLPPGETEFVPTRSPPRTVRRTETVVGEKGTSRHLRLPTPPLKETKDGTR